MPSSASKKAISSTDHTGEQFHQPWAFCQKGQQRLSSRPPADTRQQPPTKTKLCDARAGWRDMPVAWCRHWLPLSRNHFDDLHSCQRPPDPHHGAYLCMRSLTLSPILEPFLRPGALSAIVLQDAPVIRILHKSLQLSVREPVWLYKALRGVWTIGEKDADACQGPHRIGHHRRHTQILGCVQEYDTERPIIGGRYDHVSLLNYLADLLGFQRAFVHGDIDLRIDFEQRLSGAYGLVDPQGVGEAGDLPVYVVRLVRVILVEHEVLEAAPGQRAGNHSTDTAATDDYHSAGSDARLLFGSKDSEVPLEEMFVHISNHPAPLLSRNQSVRH